MFARKVLLGALPLALVASLTTVSPSIAISTGGRVDWATTYVAAQQAEEGSFSSSFGSKEAATADAVLSLVASGQGSAQVEDAMDWLEENVATIDNVGKKAKIVMAAVAAGREPRDFGPAGADLVKELELLEGDDGVYESSPFSQVYDQALVLLALDAADAAIPRRAARWLADAQCPDGGWQFDLPKQPGENARCYDAENVNEYTESDTNTTGLVLQALAAVRRSVPLDADPFQWLGKRRDPVKHGWGYDRNSQLTDSASTAIVIQAYAAHRRALPKSAVGALNGLQRYCNAGDGGFSRGWIRTEAGKYRREAGVDQGNSVAAILGLLRKPLPIEPKPYLKKLPTSLPCDPVS